MAQRATKQAKLDVAAHERLGELQSSLTGQSLPGYVDRTDILSALVMFTTPEQLAGMVAGYWRYTESQKAAETKNASDQ
jgi:hypothetical protein